MEPNPEVVIARIAAAIGAPARVRILYSLLDGRAHTSTELAVVAQVSPSTASIHLQRLNTQQLVKVFVQGKHRYYSLAGPEVGSALEALHLIAGSAPARFVSSTPSRLRAARTCYDHIAGRLGVLLHDRFQALGWLLINSTGTDNAYDLSPAGAKALQSVGFDLEAARRMRRRFGYGCLDWSERQPHIGGALGATLLKTALKRRWLVRELDSRAVTLTRFGRAELLTRFGLQV